MIEDQYIHSELEQILARISDAFVRVDVHWRITYFNEKAEQITGKSAVEVVGKDLWDKFPESLHSEFPALARRAMETQLEQHDEAYFAPYNRWMESDMYPTKDGLTIYFRDVTEKKIRDMELKHSGEVLALIMNASLDAIICVSDEGGITFWNPHAEKIFGWKSNEVMGKHLSETIIPPQYRERHERGWAHYRTTGKGTVLNRLIEISALHKDGSEFPVELIISPIEQKEGYFFCAYVRDISARKKTEEILRASEANYRKLVEGNPQPLWIYSTHDLKILEVNQAAVQKYGYTREEFLNLSIKDLRPAEEYEKFEKFIKGDIIKQGGIIQSGPWRHRLKNGTLVDVEITSQSVEWNGDNARVTMAWDVTARVQMENSLRTAEEQYRSIFENTREGIYQSTPEGKFITANTSLAKMIGYDSADELIASIQDIGREFYADPAERLRVMELLETEGRVIGLESKVYTKQKNIIWIRDHIRAIKNKEGTILYCEGTMEDITERKEAESKLRLQQQFSNMIMRAQSLFIGSKDSRRAFDVLLDDMLSITKSEYGFIGEVLYNTQGHPYLKTHTITDISWNDETRKFYNDNIQDGLVFANLKTLFGHVMVTGKAVIANSPSTDPRRGGLPDGHPPLNAFLGLPFGSDGQIEGMLGLSNREGGYDDDIINLLEPFVSSISQLFKVAQSERLRKLAAEALYASENKLQAFFRSSRDASILMGMNSEILAFNPSAREFVLSSGGQVLREGESFVELIPQEMRKSVDLLVAKALQGQALQEEFLIPDLDNEKQWWLMSFMPALDKDGKTFGVVVSATNISEIKRAERILQNQFDELQKTNHELDRFVYSVSHDLRAPLASILGLINVSEIEPDKAALNNYLVMIRESVNRLDGFIKDILNYSRNARMDINIERIDFAVLLEDVQKRLKPISGAERLNVSITVNGEVPFYSDKTRIEIILNNLYSNAIKYQDFQKDTALVSITITVTEETMTMIFLDNGIGIEKKHFQKIFTMFYRASDRAKGSGLGLYIARETVVKLGGKIGIQSAYGSSTQFEITIPNRRSTLFDEEGIVYAG